MKEQITVTVNGKPNLAAAGVTLAEIIGVETPCGGHGKCGKCKVIAKGNLSEPSDAERRLLSDDEIACGIRLACIARALGDCEIMELPAIQTAQIVTDGALPEFEIKPTFLNYGIAVDIGTTTLAARLYDNLGNVLSEVSCLNPQSRWGADVISRIEAALDGKASLLADAIRNALNRLVCELTEKIGAKNIDGMVITGNTVMLSLLTEESVEPFSHAPFAANRLFGETLAAEDLKLFALQPGTPIYLPPCISAFVGADITCALVVTQLCGADTAMLADIGTNGEMALWHKGKLTVCSTAAGPAFEGVGISMGMRGAVGAIDRVRISDGKITAHIIGDAEPVGICGSGLVDAAACMLEDEIIDEGGYLEDEPFVIEAPVTLVAKDIRMLQLAKSAICAGIRTLLDHQAVSAKDVRGLYIAGGFGNYLNKESAVKIGLLPRKLAEVSRTVGNAALGGAAMLLLNSDVKATAEKIAKNANVLDLSANGVFSEHYIAGMLFEEI